MVLFECKFDVLYEPYRVLALTVIKKSYKGHLSFSLISKRAPLVGNSSKNKMSYAVSCKLGARKLDPSLKIYRRYIATVTNSQLTLNLSLTQLT